MLKIKYEKNYHKHEAVEKVKRQLVKAYKVAEGLSYIYANIVLVGIEDLDYKAIRYYYDSEFEKLRDRMTKDIEENKEYNQGFHISSAITTLKFIDELNTALSFTGNYPIIPVKIHEYEFRTETLEDKYNELKTHFQNNQFEGFNKEYFAIVDDKEWRLWGFTFTKEDLKNAKSVRLKYQ